MNNRRAFIIGLKSTKLSFKEKNFIKKYKPWGIILFERNINTINQTGRSMIFTSFILFFGFIIFAFSDFGGTIVLGVLTSIILFVAMITNLTLLPSIILHFYKKN